MVIINSRDLFRTGAYEWNICKKSCLGKVFRFRMSVKSWYLYLSEDEVILPYELLKIWTYLKQIQIDIV